ncbi:MAG: acyl-CoA thioesterase [Bdellovibrionales bacterium]
MNTEKLVLDDTLRFDITRYRHWVEDHVRFSDLDPLGHTNNNAIGEYFENARAALFVEVTPSWPRREQIFVLARITIDYRHELHMPAALRIGTCVTGFGHTSMRMASAVFHGKTGIAYAETVSVLIEEKTRKPVEIPQDLRAVLMKYGA